MNAADVHRIVHGYLLEHGWQRHEADSLYHRPDNSVGYQLGAAVALQLAADDINLALNPQVAVYPPPIELLAGHADIFANDAPAHQPGPTSTYPDGSPLAADPPLTDA